MNKPLLSCSVAKSGLFYCRAGDPVEGDLGPLAAPYTLGLSCFRLDSAGLEMGGESGNHVFLDFEH